MTDGGRTPAWFGQVPDRAVAERIWAAVADGSLSRERAHEWAVPWVEGDAGPRPDAMVSRALTYLHGFDMAASTQARPSLMHHGPPGIYYRTLDDVRVELERWRADCIEYDADPQGWLAAKLAMARAQLKEERRVGALGAAVKRDAGRQDRFAVVRRLAGEHASEPFPDCRGEEVGGVDLVALDADLRSCVWHFLGDLRALDAWQRDLLERVSDDLDRVQEKLSPGCVRYFRQARALAVSLLAALDDDDSEGLG